MWWHIHIITHQNITGNCLLVAMVFHVICFNTQVKCDRLCLVFCILQKSFGLLSCLLIVFHYIKHIHILMVEGGSIVNIVVVVVVVVAFVIIFCPWFWIRCLYECAYVILHCIQYCAFISKRHILTGLWILFTLVKFHWPCGIQRHEYINQLVQFELIVP